MQGIVKRVGCGWRGGIKADGAEAGLQERGNDIIGSLPPCSRVAGECGLIGIQPGRARVDNGFLQFAVGGVLGNKRGGGGDKIFGEFWYLPLCIEVCVKLEAPLPRRTRDRPGDRIDVIRPLPEGH